MSAQYVLCGHMSVQYALSRQFCWFPLGIVSVLDDTSAQIEVTKVRERPYWTQQAVITAFLLQQLYVYGWPGCVYGRPVYGGRVKRR